MMSPKINILGSNRSTGVVWYVELLLYVISRRTRTYLSDRRVTGPKGACQIR